LGVTDGRPLPYTSGFLSHATGRGHPVGRKAEVALEPQKGSAKQTASGPLDSDDSMADRVRSFDWARTALGPIDRWPLSLRTAVDICLHSRFPMRIWWGADLINIYNDAYAVILGRRHPGALGMSARVLWADLWSEVGPQVDAVMRRGESTWAKRFHLNIERNGASEEMWVTWSYTPVRDEAGTVAGILCIAMNETPHMLAERDRAAFAEHRRRAANESERQARIFDTTLSSTPDLHYIMNADCRFVYANKALLDLWGIPLAEAAGKNFADLNFPDDLGAVLTGQVREVFETGKRLVGETAYLSPSGVNGYYEYIFSPVFGPDGKVEAMAGSSRDITGRKKSELDRERLLRTLDAERANLAAIVEQAPAFIVVLRGPEHTVELANERYYDVIGRRDIVGKPIRDALPEVEGQGFFELLDGVFQTGRPFQGNEVPVRIGPPGATQLRYVNFVYQALRGVDGNVTGIFTHGVDVTDSVRAREALQEREARFRQLADAMPQIVWTALPNGVLNYCNRKWFEFIDRPEDAGHAADWSRHVHPDDLPEVAAQWVAVLKSGDPYNVEFRVRGGDGQYRDFLTRALPIRDENGAIVHWFGTCTDISDRKRIEAEREHVLAGERAARTESERASQMKDEFLATLSHEIRTPLNAILGWSQIMRSSPDPDDIAQGLDVIERNARAQSQIVEDLLDMSKIISGKVRLDVQRLDLAAIVQTAVETARPTTEAKGIRLHSVIDPLIGVVVSGDANRLQQVLWNLISNAVKFTPKGGRIQVLLERIDSHLEVSVIDSGEGIRPEFLPYVFDRFRQADASTTRRHGGLGLGLSIVKQLVELHGGSVRVTSAGPGHGTTFVVALPLVVVHPEPEGAPERRHPTATGLSGRLADACDDIAGLRVLVIDDEPDARALVKRLLEDCHAMVTATASVGEAIDAVRTGKFDVLVSDIGMPGEDGYSLIRRVRALDSAHGGNIPAIALTAYARAEDRVKAVSAGFQMHVTKPVEPVELVTMVAGAAGRTGKR
jgi:PAS domain S-box-containing protein